MNEVDDRGGLHVALPGRGICGSTISRVALRFTLAYFRFLPPRGMTVCEKWARARRRILYLRGLGENGCESFCARRGAGG